VINYREVGSGVKQQRKSVLGEWISWLRLGDRVPFAESEECEDRWIA